VGKVVETFLDKNVILLKYFSKCSSFKSYFILLKYFRLKGKTSSCLLRSA
jgi:hypothetical protein